MLNSGKARTTPQPTRIAAKIYFRIEQPPGLVLKRFCQHLVARYYARKTESTISIELEKKRIRRIGPQDAVPENSEQPVIWHMHWSFSYSEGDFYC